MYGVKPDEYSEFFRWLHASEFLWDAPTSGIVLVPDEQFDIALDALSFNLERLPVSGVGHHDEETRLLPATIRHEMRGETHRHWHAQSREYPIRFGAVSPP